MKRHIPVVLMLMLLLAGAIAASTTETVVLRVSGMSCSGCAEGIESMLKRTDGVVKADVSYHTREATVAFDPAKATPETIIAAIEKMGYKATIKKS